MVGRHTLRAVTAVAVALAVAACGGPSPTSNAGQSSGSQAATGSGSPVASAPASESLQPTGSAAATPTPAPTPAPTVALGAWKDMSAAGALAQVQLTTIVWTGHIFVAGATTTNGSATILDSADGANWDLQTTAWANTTIRAMADGPNNLVAVGDKAGVMVAWTSSDGTAWKMVPDSTAMHASANHSMRVAGVAAVDGGWMAVGEEDPAVCLSGCVPTRAVIWTSPDGVTWKQQAASPVFAGARLTSVVEASGRYVAVGSAGQGTQVAAVWTSPDGSTWTRVPDGAQFHAPAGTDTQMGAGMNSVTVLNDRFIAVGQVFTQGAVGSVLAWWSDDAATWTAATGDRFLNGQAFSVAATLGGLLAVGPSGDQSCLGGIWSSPDGSAWTCEASNVAFFGFKPNAVAASPTLQVVVGFGRATGAMTGAVWTRTIGNP